MKIRFFKMAVLTAAAVLLAASCNKDDEELMFLSTATFKRTGENSFYFKESDTTAFIPTNLPVDFLKPVTEKRTVIWFTSDRKPVEHGIEGYKCSYLIDVQAIDTVYTKNPVVSKGSSLADDKEYGSDYVGLYLKSSGMFPYTSIDDGYLCIRFVFESLPYTGVTHYFNLVTGVNPDDPYEVELHHDACGQSFGDSTDGYMAFPLKSLPPTNGETKKVTLVWKSGVTMQKERFSFDYCSRTDWPE